MSKKKVKGDGYVQRFAGIIYPSLVRKKRIFGAGASGEGKSRTVIAAISVILWDLIRTWFWCIIFVFIPAILLNFFRPGLEDRYEVISIYLWFWMIAVRKGLVWTDVLKLGRYERELMRSFNISFGDSFLGRFKFKIWTEFAYHIAILFIFRISVYNVIAMSFMALYFRIIGERRELKSFQKNEGIDFDVRRKNKTLIRIVCSCAAYIFPLAVGIMGNGWYWLVGPLVMILMIPKVLLDYRYLTHYKNYGFLMTEVSNHQYVTKGIKGY